MQSNTESEIMKLLYQCQYVVQIRISMNWLSSLSITYTYNFQFKSVLFCVGETISGLLSDVDLKYLLVFDEGTVTTIHGFLSAVMHNSRTALRCQIYTQSLHRLSARLLFNLLYSKTQRYH